MCLLFLWRSLLLCLSSRWRAQFRMWWKKGRRAEQPPPPATHSFGIPGQIAWHRENVNFPRHKMRIIGSQTNGVDGGGGGGIDCAVERKGHWKIRNGNRRGGSAIKSVQRCWIANWCATTMIIPFLFSVLFMCLLAFGGFLFGWKYQIYCSSFPFEMVNHFTSISSR